MVATVDHVPARAASCPRSLIVELIGPAGSGKTTVAQMLQRRSDAQLAVLPYYRSARQVPFFAANSLGTLPTIARLDFQRPRLSRRQIAWMVILRGWHRQLLKQAAGGAGVLVLDHGPIFLLAGLQVLGPSPLTGNAARSWWAAMYRQWAAALDMVVWLDAPDPVLARRIRQRDQVHFVKDEPDVAIFEFLQQFRAAFYTVIEGLGAAGRGPPLLHLDTGRCSACEAVQQIAIACGVEPVESR
jgi:gluconate kinase